MTVGSRRRGARVGSGLAGTIVEAADISSPSCLFQELVGGLYLRPAAPSRSFEPGEVDGPLLNLFPSAPCPGSARRGETYTARAPTVNTQEIIPSAKSRSFGGGPESTSSRVGREIGKIGKT